MTAWLTPTKCSSCPPPATARKIKTTRLLRAARGCPGVIHIFGRQTNDDRKLEGEIDQGNAAMAWLAASVHHPGGCVRTLGKRLYVRRVSVLRNAGRALCLLPPAELRRLQGRRVRHRHRRRRHRGRHERLWQATHIKDKLNEYDPSAETLYCCSIACSAEGKPTAAGNYYVDPLLANVVSTTSPS